MTKLETLHQLLTQKQAEIKELELILSDLMSQRDRCYKLQDPDQFNLTKQIYKNFDERWSAYYHRSQIIDEIEKETKGEKND